MKIKILNVLMLVIMLFSVTHQSAFADCGTNWYVKRCGNKQPAIENEQKIIEKYNGYYIDKKHGDDSEKKIIYLTFDAGYENGNVEAILNVLKEKSVPAAFFILDHIILKNTDIVLRMANEGHLVCNHTKNHKDLTELGDDEIIKNVTDLEKIYEEKTGMKMAKYFRFPEGKYSEKALSVINDLGYKSIFWSFAYEDWDNGRQPSADKAIRKILDNTHNGEVILLHPTSATNAKILPNLIDAWRDMGYSFGTLDDLVK